MKKYLTLIPILFSVWGQSSYAASPVATISVKLPVINVDEACVTDKQRSSFFDPWYSFHEIGLKSVQFEALKAVLEKDERGYKLNDIVELQDSYKKPFMTYSSEWNITCNDDSFDAVLSKIDADDKESQVASCRPGKASFTMKKKDFRAGKIGGEIYKKISWALRTDCSSLIENSREYMLQPGVSIQQPGGESGGKYKLDLLVKGFKTLKAGIVKYKPAYVSIGRGGVKVEVVPYFESQQDYVEIREILLKEESITGEQYNLYTTGVLDDILSRKPFAQCSVGDKCKQDLLRRLLSQSSVARSILDVTQWIEVGRETIEQADKYTTPPVPEEAPQAETPPPLPSSAHVAAPMRVKWKNESDNYDSVVIKVEDNTVCAEGVRWLSICTEEDEDCTGIKFSYFGKKNPDLQQSCKKVAFENSRFNIIGRHACTNLLELNANKGSQECSVSMTKSNRDTLMNIIRNNPEIRHFGLVGVYTKQLAIP